MLIDRKILLGRVMHNSELKIADYVFVTAMAIELTVKVNWN